VRGTSFEVSIFKQFLKAGAFDAQGLVTVAPPRLIKKLGELHTPEIVLIETAVRRWLSL
jgi:hypothetical protein